MPLTDLKIRKAKQTDKAYKLNDGLGLTLLVRPTGTKSWQFRYQRARSSVVSMSVLRSNLKF
ncbi:MAG: Arm DNA-binding domain-containing protein [Pseudomonadota bacterium]